MVACLDSRPLYPVSFNVLMSRCLSNISSCDLINQHIRATKFSRHIFELGYTIFIHDLALLVAIVQEHIRFERESVQCSGANIQQTLLWVSIHDIPATCGAKCSVRRHPAVRTLAEHLGLSLNGNFVLRVQTSHVSKPTCPVLTRSAAAQNFFHRLTLAFYFNSTTVASAFHSAFRRKAVPFIEKASIFVANAQRIIVWKLISRISQFWRTSFVFWKGIAHAAILRLGNTHMPHNRSNLVFSEKRSRCKGNFAPMINIERRTTICAAFAVCWIIFFVSARE